MAEIKNSFLRSKMNKDLDDRLIPNGEYRDAQNISVGKSEDDDIGALETILGNVAIANIGNNTGDIDSKCIGYFADEARGEFYLFYTQNILTSIVPGKKNYIYKFNPSANLITKLVEGDFLNFSTQSAIQCVLIEDLLFFTDNRNQPRKINISKSLGYYTTEDQISVAKYAPYQPISMIKEATGNILSSTATTFVIEAILTGITSVAGTFDQALVLSTAEPTIKPGMVIGGFIASTSPTFVTVLSAQITGSTTSITLSSSQDWASGATISFYPGFEMLSSIISEKNPSTGLEYIPFEIAAYVSNWIPSTATISADNLGGQSVFPVGMANVKVAFLKSTMTNQSNNPTWPGDPDYLEDKFVRFSYRFQFDDGEYSIIAPYTQIAFIPRQEGYFTQDNENDAYRTTILDWMENNVQNIELIIPLPDKAINLGTENSSTYKITGIDIIYKEADSIATRVLDSIPIASLNCSDCSSTKDINYYVYDFQSRKPYKTLPTSQTTRVYDITPTKAKAIETSGNRVIYGNFFNQHTPPTSLNYQIGVNRKRTTYSSRDYIEYPNHTLKQNRNYQVGVILSDKFGRQSSVILSSVEETTTQKPYSVYTDDWDVIYGGSTVYAPYRSEFISVSNSASPGGTSNILTIDIVDPMPIIPIGTYVIGVGIPYSTRIESNTTAAPGTKAWVLDRAISIQGDIEIYFQSDQSLYWPGNTLLMSFNSPITSGTVVNGVANHPSETTGEPGLYAVPIGNGIGFRIVAGGTYPNWVYPTIVNNILTCQIDTITPDSNIPSTNQYLRGVETDYVKITSRSWNSVTRILILTCDGPINEYYTSVVQRGANQPFINGASSYTINPTGWYSYKIVVRQQEQEYYNVYLPGILNGYPEQPSPTVITTTNNLNTNGGTSILYSGATYSGNAEFVTSGMRLSGAALIDPLPIVLGIGQGASNFEVFLNQSVVVPVNSTLNYTKLKTWGTFPSGEDGRIANVVLLNDNINKVPRDLTEVGPDQKQFRSSVQLFARVSNVIDAETNAQWFPGIKTNTAVSISTANESNMTIDDITELGDSNLYQIDTNPLISRVSIGLISPSSAGITVAATPVGSLSTLTSQGSAAQNSFILPKMFIKNKADGTFYGIVKSKAPGTNPENADWICNIITAIPAGTIVLITSQIGLPTEIMKPYLAIYETEAVESLLDLYWETSSSELISDLNSDVLNDYNGAAQFSNIIFTGFNEAVNSDTYISNSFSPQDSLGVYLEHTSINMKVLDGNGRNSTGKFQLEVTSLAGVITYRIKTAIFANAATVPPFIYTHDSSVSDVYTFYMEVVITEGVTSGADFETNPNTLSFQTALGNITPSSTGSNPVSIPSTTDFIGEILYVGNSNIFSGYTNGAYGQSNIGLQWEKLSGSSAFSINAYTGALSKNEVVAAGTYSLSYTVHDAWNGSDLGVGSLKVSQVSVQVVIT